MTMTQALPTPAAQAQAMERERCAAVVRYWLAGYAEPKDPYVAKCLAHILNGTPAPVGPSPAPAD